MLHISSSKCNIFVTQNSKNIDDTNIQEVFTSQCVINDNLVASSTVLFTAVASNCYLL